MGIELSELPQSLRKQAEKKYYAEMKRKQKTEVLVLGKEDRISSDEGAEQETVFSWARLNEGRYPCLKTLHHIPNGGMRNRGEAAKLKRQGVKAGVADLFLPHASSGCHGLYIELKAKGGVVSREQTEFLEAVSRAGYMAAVCFGAQSAICLLEKYLGGKACGN